MTELPGWLSGRRIAYLPITPDLSAPGDRRRFAYWARQRGVRLETARPGERYDLLVLSERADITAWARAPRNGTTVVFDFVDSYLSVPRGAQDLARGSGKWVLRQHAHLVPSYRAAVERMCARADIVVCSSPEQAVTLRPHARDVRPILDVHEEVPARSAPPPREAGLLRLFWEGLPQNIRGFRPAFDHAIRSLSQSIDVELHLVTDLATPHWFGRLGTLKTERLVDGLAGTAVVHAWSAETLREVAAQCDVGVIPLDLEDPLAAGKPENKLALMWRLGLPVVASATPAYHRVMAEAGLDLTCRNAVDWERALRTLAHDPDSRVAAAQRGMDYVAVHHTPQVLLAKWDKLVQDALVLDGGTLQ